MVSDISMKGKSTTDDEPFEAGDRQWPLMENFILL